MGSYWVDSSPNSSSGVEQTELNMGSGMPPKQEQGITTKQKVLWKAECI